MIKDLDNHNTLITNNFFPKKFSKSSKAFRVLLGVGGNINNPLRNFKKLIFTLKRDLFIDIIQTSPILRNPPFGYLKQPDFYNCVIVIQTDLTPNRLLHRLHYLEKKFQRVRTFANAPRPLDLDIIFFENKKVYNHRLIIPHLQWRERSSVLIPLIMLD